MQIGQAAYMNGQSKIIMPGVTVTYTTTVAEREAAYRTAGVRAFIQMVGEHEWSECGLPSAALLAHAIDRGMRRGREWRLAIIEPGKD